MSQTNKPYIHAVLVRIIGSWGQEKKKQCWRDGSLCKVPALEACGPELDLPEPTPKR